MANKKSGVYLFDGKQKQHKLLVDVVFVAKLRHPVNKKGHSHVVAYIARDATGNTYLARTDGMHIKDVTIKEFLNGKSSISLPCRKNSCEEKVIFAKDVDGNFDIKPGFKPEEIKTVLDTWLSKSKSTKLLVHGNIELIESPV